MSNSQALASAIERLEAAAKSAERAETTPWRYRAGVPVTWRDIRTVLDALREMQTKEKKP